MRHVLVDETGAEVKPGMRLVTSNHEIYELVSFQVPRHEASTGRVNVKKVGENVAPGHERQFYPSVFGLKIREIAE